MESSRVLEKLAGPLEFCIWVTGDAAAVARAWNSAEELQNWFVARAENRDSLGGVIDEAKEGGSYLWARLEGSEERGTFRQVLPDALEFGWCRDAGIVRVEWHQEAGEVLVKLRQEMFEGTVEERASIQQEGARSWAFWLGCLKCWIEYGLTLRETNPAHKKAINV